MAKTTSAAYPQTHAHGYGVTTAATASLNDDSPDNTVTILTAGAEGNRVTKIWAIPRATSLAGVLYIWVSTDDGTTLRLAVAQPIAANTVSATSAPVPVEIYWNSDPARPISEAEPWELKGAAVLYAGYSQALSAGMVFHVTSIVY